MFKGIIFDMDGTMVDNMMVHHRAWQHKLAELGLNMSIEEVKEKIHGVNEEILARLFGERFTPDERQQIAWEKEEAYRNIYRPELRLIDGLAAFLDEVKAAGIPMAIGTAAPPENTDFVLDTLELRPYFEGVFHSKSVRKGKPDPEIFELAAASMGLAARDCLIFEDSVTGAEAAKRAGAQVVIVTTTHAVEEFAGYAHILQFIANYEALNRELLNFSINRH
ncbi:MAG: HAD family phosphatase [Bacteroidetes bacterium]|nr:MAG: HAD family phosphatase [Bacteroidota bacterium]